MLSDKERRDALAKLAQARKLIQEMRQVMDLPQIERCLSLADMNLHFAQWNLGEDVGLAPELEEE
ncbi:MAG: hypothetical protein HYU86_07645 [Chloroflexi bacterium]|nr:hypothetical protein [Chloroflexota bacterium]